MKIQITFKDPDGVSESIREAAKASVPHEAGLSDDELETLADGRAQEMTDAIKPWVEFGEYLTVIFDTEAKTATVVPAR